MGAPDIAFYGDDFTGATDTLSTVAQAGLRALLFLRVPDAGLLERAGPLDVLGIAGTARSLDPDAMAAELLPVGRFLARLGTRIVHYKTCSTFDSAPQVGSIGGAIAALRPLSPNPLVAIVGGQPNLGRYCVFGNLFATVQAGGEPQRIDRHETMSRHPVTPMNEADLRLHLARQGLRRVASLAYVDYDLPVDALCARVDALVREGADAVLLDVGHESHLPVVGDLLWRHAARAAPLLVAGPSSVAQALIRAGGAGGAVRTPPSALPPPAPATGPVLVLAGSLSGVSARQRTAATSYAQVAVDPRALVEGGLAAVAPAIAEITKLLSAGRHVLVHTSGSAPQAEPPRVHAGLAPATGRLLRHLLSRSPLRRVGVAGGDTSSHAVRSLDAWGLSHIGQVAPGVALCRLHADSPQLDGMELMLKGGQMGAPDVFERLLGIA